MLDADEMLVGSHIRFRGIFRYETISDLMGLQDRIDQFQKRVFAHFRPSSNNECRIAALVPLVEESYGIYKFITSMLRAMHRREYSFPVWVCTQQ
jgi:ANTH domain